MLRMAEAERDRIHIVASGKLTSRDYETLAPELDRILDQHGQLRCVVDLQDFSGWARGGLVAHGRFALGHRDAFAKLAVVGEKLRHEWLTRMAAAFLPGEVRYYDRLRADDALRWIGGRKSVTATRGRRAAARSSSLAPG